MTSEEEVKGQGQLGERALRGSIDGGLSVQLEDASATVTPQVSEVPLVVAPGARDVTMTSSQASEVPLVQRYRFCRPVARA